MNPAFFADVILVTHAAFVMFVVLSVPLILLGAWRRWQWIGNPWFRLSHLGAMLFVMMQTWLDKRCPLTIWENALRQQAGQSGYSDGFIAYWLGQFVFYDLPGWVFTVLYTAFAALIIALFWIAPIRRVKV